MIQTEGDPRKPNGSCQRLLTAVANSLPEGEDRGKIKVGSEGMKTMFEIGLQELRLSFGEDESFLRHLERVSIQLA